MRVTGLTEEILQLRRDNPTISGSDIARRLGVSRQWVSEVLKAHGLSNRRPEHLNFCRNCGKPAPDHCVYYAECWPTCSKSRLLHDHNGRFVQLAQ